jgi:hypothetical protein
MTNNRRIWVAWINERNEMLSPSSYWTNEDQDEIDRRVEESFEKDRKLKADWAKIEKITDPYERAVAVALYEGCTKEEAINGAEALMNLNEC